MPKKHKTVITPSSSNYIHPSLSSSKPIAVNSPPAPASVNERLARLRKEHPSQELTQRQRDLADGTRQKSVPPAVGGLLGLPNAAPPPPQSGMQPRRLRIGTPGPAPPRSWLAAGHVFRGYESALEGGITLPLRSRHQHGKSQDQIRKRPTKLAAFSTATGIDGIDRRSLTHYALRTIAQSWSSMDPTAVQYLSEFPEQVRTALLPYIAYYGPEEGLSSEDLALIMHLGGLPSLDLTGLIGWTVPMKDLRRILPAKSDIPKKQKTKKGPEAEPELAETWDDEGDSVKSDRPSLGIPTPMSAPTIITKLSLASPPPTISWPDLLSLTHNLPTLTHLSLSEWPYPTKTPNMAHGFYMTPNGKRVAASASSLYANLDGHHTEGALMLRQLSRQTYCLKWLDLSGCDWVAALAPISIPDPGPRVNPPGGFIPVIDVPPRRARTGIVDDNLGSDAWSHSYPSLSGPEWDGAWSSIEYLKVAQCSAPEDLPAVSAVAPSQKHPMGLPSAEGSFVRRDLITYFDGIDSIGSTSTVRASWLHLDDSWEVWRAPRNREKLCNACGEIIGSLKGVGGRDCEGCKAWYNHRERLVTAWVEKEVGLREVGRRIKTMRRTAKGRPIKVDLGWMTI